MKRFLGLVFALSLIGCTSAPTQKIVKTESQYVYDKILILPFKNANPEQKSLAYKVFSEELKKFPDIQVVGQEDFEEHLLENLNLSLDKEYSLDQFSGPEGKAELQTIADALAVKAILFGKLTVENNLVDLYIEMLNAEQMSLTLSFSKTEEIIDNDIEGAINTVVYQAAEKVSKHIEDNVTITNIYKYQ